MANQLVLACNGLHQDAKKHYKVGILTINSVNQRFELNGWLTAFELQVPFLDLNKVK